MTSGLTEYAETGLTLLRRLAAAFGNAFTLDEVARGALDVALEIPGVMRAGIALDNVGGRQLQFVSTDPDALTSTRVQWCLIDAFADVPLNDAVRDETDVFVSTVAELDTRYPSISARQRELGTRSLVALSLSTGSERVGGLLLSFSTEQEFDAEQRWLLGALASQMSQALRAGVVHQARQATAEQLQHGLMPRSLPEIAGLSLGAHYQPGGTGSDVGGDWYDVIELPDEATALVLGDIAGRGTRAAMVMSEMRAALRAYVVLDPAPSAVLERMDSFVASRPGSEQLVTVAYGVVSADRRTLTFALAGHPPPLSIHPGGPTRQLGAATGPALGLGAGPWPETEVELAPGHVVVFYSDGVESSRTSERSGITVLASLIEALAPRRKRPRELCARIAQLSTLDRTDDDVALLAVAAAPPGTRRASSQLPEDLTAPRLARRFLRQTLGDWGVEDEIVEVAELCVSELATNAVIHTGTSTELAVEIDTDTVTVLVHDAGTAGTVQLAAQQTDVLDIAGRGLALVDALTTSWAAEHQADGTTVWFEIERSP